MQTSYKTKTNYTDIMWMFTAHLCEMPGPIIFPMGKMMGI